MRRETKRFWEGDDQVRIVNRIFSEQTQRNSPSFDMTKFRLLKNIAENPEILLCELNHFEVLKVYHDGTSWVAESQATIHVDPNSR